jgi:hypothetical protein
MKTFQSGRLDFASNIGIIPVSDPNITSRAEKIIQAQQVLVEAKQNPLMQNPVSLYFATRAYLEALRTPNLDVILQKPQPPEPKDLPADQENSMFLREQSAEPLIQQDHMAHWNAHDIFMNSQWGEELTPQGKKVMEVHIRTHKAMMYAVEQQAKKHMARQAAALEGMLGNA